MYSALNPLNKKTPDYSGVFNFLFKNQIQNGIEVKNVNISAIDWLMITPSKLKKYGKIKIRGMK